MNGQLPDSFFFFFWRLSRQDNYSFPINTPAHVGFNASDPDAQSVTVRQNINSLLRLSSNKSIKQSPFMAAVKVLLCDAASIVKFVLFAR